jgi:protein SCO1/2/putative membrane protein
MNRVFLLIVVSLLLLAWPLHAQTVGSTSDSLRNSLGPMPPFKLTDQNGNTVTRQSMEGKVCVVSIFFSCCDKVCPKTQAAMARLQERFAGSGDVLLISININPIADDPETIAEYAKDRQADPRHWLFLHGDHAEIYELVQGGLKQGLERHRRSVPGKAVDHPPRLLLVDHWGVIRGYVDGDDPAEVDRLALQMRRLIQAKYFPRLNASLNASCGVLLVLGFLFIKVRQVTLHKVVMLLAVVVSAVFLGCYLYYHFVVLDGQPTRFSGEGAVRQLYLAILLSHTVLAVVVAPLALTITYLGLRNRLARHVFLARWTLPVWLYVSITGVVVYWMLYHLYPPG